MRGTVSLKLQIATFLCGCALLTMPADGASTRADQNPALPRLTILVIDGEDAVNIIQQKTAVAPVVEVRDQNNQPVAGAVVRFAIRGGRATFSGANTLTVTTNVAGQAAVSGLTPTSAGAFQISAAASFQGQTAAAVIAQTNVLTAAEAAKVAAGAGAGGSSGGGAGAGSGGAATGGGGLSLTTIGVVGAVVAGGVVAVDQLQGSSGTRYSGQISGSENLVFSGVFCRTEALTGTLDMDLEIDSGGAVTGTAQIEGRIVRTAVSPGCLGFFPINSTDGFGMDKTLVAGTSGSMTFMKAQTNTVPPGPADPGGGVNTHEWTFAGALNGDVITGSLFHRRIITGTVAATSTLPVTLR